jgi:hypothetical protein
MGRRNEREDMIVETLAVGGWHRDAREVAGAVRGYRDTYRIGYVSAGSGEGRSTTLIDAFRSFPSRSVMRLDMLTVKGSALELYRGEVKFPAYAFLSTGGRDTLEPMITAIRTGAALPVFHFASLPGSDGPTRDGWFLAYDAGPLIRAAGDLAAGPQQPGHKWGRGRMPAFSIGMTPGIKSGGKYVKHTPGWYNDWTYATDAEHISYARMEIGYLNAGLSNGWQRCSMDEIPAIIESVFDWTGSGVSVYT